MKKKKWNRVLAVAGRVRKRRCRNNHGVFMLSLIHISLAPYYYFTSSMYKGECTSSRVGMMTAKSSDTALYVAKINGKQVCELVKNYLADADENFYVTNKYELPIASGMKMIVNQEESGCSLKDLTVNDKKIDKEKEYSILLTDTTMLSLIHI